MRVRGWWGWLALLLPACQGPGVPVREIPEQSIALHYYDAETARRRAEAVEAADPNNVLPELKEGVARVDDISSFMERVLGVEQRSASGEPLDRRFPGRLALLDPHTQKVELLRSARPGARPAAWSPDGRRLMFSQVSGQYRQLYELDVETREVRPLTRGPDVHADGCYGPGGRLVVTRARVEGERAVQSIDLAGRGSEPRRALSKGPNDYAPSCAPDGSAVAWVEIDDKGRDHLWVWRVGTEGEPEVRRLGRGRDPAFSPDSQWIVYSSPVQRRWALHRIRSDGSGRRRIGTGSYDEEQPTLSPDGRLVAYVGEDGLQKRIYLRRFDGTGDSVLLETGGGLHPLWRSARERSSGR